MWKYLKNGQIPFCSNEGDWDGKRSEQLLFQDINGNYHVGEYYDFGSWYNSYDYEIYCDILRFIEISAIDDLNVTVNRYSEEYTPPFRVGKKQKRAVLDSKGSLVILFPRDNGQAELYCKYLNN